MTRTLFELAHIESPFVWRAKLALSHKKLEYTPQRLPFTEIPHALDGVSNTVPVLREADGTDVKESWGIAEYLDKTYPDAPKLLGEARAGEIDEIVSNHVFPSFFPLYVHDIWSCLPDDQAAYFRESREARFGVKLEEISANREDRLPGAREGIQPLRDVFNGKLWLNGDTPGYADHIALAFFVWIKSVAKIPPLEVGDPLLDWIDRGFALYDGAASKVSGGPLSS